MTQPERFRWGWASGAAIVFTLLALAAAATSLWPSYLSGQFVLMAAVTIAVGIAIALIGAVWHWSAWLVASATAAGFLVLGVPLAVPSESILGLLPSGRGLLDLIAATALGWKQLLTITVPVGGYQALLVPAFLLVLVTTVTTATIALRATRSEWAVVPPVLLFAAGIVVGPDLTAVPTAAALGLLAVLLLWLVWRRRVTRYAAMARLSGRSPNGPRGEQRIDGLRAGLAAVVIIVVACVAGTAAAVALPSHSTREVARSGLVQPFDPRDYPSPLSGFRSYLEPSEASKPMLTVSGLGGERRLRIATLDDYNGVVYSVDSGSSATDSSTPDGSGSFSRVPYTLDQSGVQGRRISLSVTVDGYAGVWVPGAGQLQQIRFTGSDADQLGGGFYYNDTTGTGADLVGLKKGDRYRMDAVVGPEESAAKLADAEPGRASQSKPTIPAGLDAALQRFTAGESTAGAKLAAALKALKTEGYVSHGIGKDEPTSRSGHGSDRITQLFTELPMLGDQEQYSVAAALMARQLGFPARVVMGFVVPDGSSSTRSVTLTGADVSAWIQVQTQRQGWVTVDPNPAERPVPQKQPESPTQVSRPQSIVPPPPEPDDQQQQTPPQSKVEPDRTPKPNPWLTFLGVAGPIAGWALLGIVIVVAPFLTVIVAKVRRRSLRKRAPDAGSRIAGGWQEFADAALDHGHEPPKSATRLEVAKTVGGMRPLVLASVADRASFSPRSPSDREAEQVWKVVDELRISLGKGESRWQRFKAAVSLRSLGGRPLGKRSPGVYRGTGDGAKGD
jgi:hypothetical protein